MSDLTGLGFWIGFWLFVGVAVTVTVIAVFRSRLRRYELRNEVILKLLETGQSLEPETLDRLLALPAVAAQAEPSQAKSDPRDGYRTGNFIFFLMGFVTLLYAFARDAGLSYPLIGLGAFAIVMAFIGWWVGDRQFRDGTLPTLKYARDPREAHLNAGFVFFLIGYGTMFFGIVREAGLSYPIIALGLLLVGMCCNAWRQGNKEYREGRLTGAAVKAERE